MPSVTLGNVSHTALMSDPETGVRTRHRSTNVVQSTTIVQVVPESMYEQMRDVINLWHHESDQPPVWIESDDDDLAQALRKHFGVGAKPDDWEHIITGPPAMVALLPEAPRTEPKEVSSDQ